ncbi:hypothetical protein T439DRAFT_329514 [Meredithblackwellia eburnea MCA 4105]
MESDEDHNMSVAASSRTRSRQESPEDVGNLKEPKRKRKTYSCEQCHRLKAKCDREAPCGRCKLRGLHSSCSHLRKKLQEGNPTQTSVPTTSKHSQALPASVPSPFTALMDAASHVHFAEPPRPSTGTSSASPLADRLRQHLQQAGQLLPANSTQMSPALSDSAAVGPEGRPTVELMTVENEAVEDDEEEPGGIGTLILDEDGRSAYIGATASSEWLKEPDGHETVTPYVRAPPPADLLQMVGGSITKDSIPGVGAGFKAFPFGMSPASTLEKLEAMLHELPEKDEAKVFVDCYYRHLSHNYNIIERSTFDQILDTIYTQQLTMRSCDVHPHKLALVFAVLAIGVRFNLELSLHDPLALHYCIFAELCLSLGDFLKKNTVCAVQTLHILAHFSNHFDRRGDCSWPLWGLSLRIIQAMGIHRDGTRWKLPNDVVEERRRVFWECQCADIFQANCLSRPNTIQVGYYDTQLPASDIGGGVDTFPILKFKLAQIMILIVQQATRVEAVPYKDVQALWKKLCDFEASTPYYLRCRPAWLAIVSVSQPSDSPPLPSPEVQTHNLKLTFQQHQLAMNVCEGVLTLQRPFFTRALCQSSGDLTSSRFYPSVIAVFERCLALNAILASLHKLYPLITIRRWDIYSHAFTAGVCFGTLVILAPKSHLAPFALHELGTLISLFDATTPASRPRDNLPSLLRIQQRAKERFSAQVPPPKAAVDKISNALQIDGESLQEHGDGENSEEEHIAMMGWDTRLVRRLKSGLEHPAISVHKGPRASGVSATSGRSPSVHTTSATTPAPTLPDNFWSSLGVAPATSADLNIPGDPTSNPLWNIGVQGFAGWNLGASIGGEENLGQVSSSQTDLDFWPDIFRDFSLLPETS